MSVKYSEKRHTQRILETEDKNKIRRFNALGWDLVSNLYDEEVIGPKSILITKTT
jgi:hypothetical protein